MFAKIYIDLTLWIFHVNKRVIMKSVCIIEEDALIQLLIVNLKIALCVLEINIIIVLSVLSIHISFLLCV